ncbi:MAG TPA: tryptophan--tRNA ligase, partial [Rudaea sp.]
DQVQHIEMARDIGQRFNHIYGGEFFALPEAAIEENVATLPGTDGRKMSKSYDNTIPLWLPEKELRKAILGIVTNSQAPGEAKNPDESNLFAIYRAFASADETAAMRRAYADGIGWGDAKQMVFERVNAELAPMREKYDALIADPAQIEDKLRAGAARARALATPFVAKLRYAVGLRDLRAQPQTVAPVGIDATKVGKPALQPVVFRDGNEFAFKVLDAKKSVLAEKGGFADPKAAMTAAREAMAAL